MAKSKRNSHWEKKLKQEQLLAARKEGRKLASLEDTSRADGYSAGICALLPFSSAKIGSI